MAKKLNKIDQQVRTVPCPNCQVAADETCLTSSGAALTGKSHKARYEVLGKEHRKAAATALKKATSRDFTEEKNVRELVCPKCKAAAGYRCTAYSGRWLGFSHKERYDAYTLQNFQPTENHVSSETPIDETPIDVETLKQTFGIDDLSPGEYKVQMVAEIGSTTASERERLLETVGNTLWVLHRLQGVDWLINRLTQMIVDHEDWFAALRSEQYDK